MPQNPNIIQGENVSFPAISSFSQNPPGYGIPTELQTIQAINQVDETPQLFPTLVVNQPPTEFLMHRPPQKPCKRARRFTCQFIGCDRAFDSQWALERHIRIHTGEKPFVCSHPNCGKSFSDKGALKRHELSHDPDKPYKCTHPGCCKSFKAKSYLDHHMRLHTETDPYRCTFKGCNRSFSSPKSLKRHERVYHGTNNEDHTRENELREKIIRLENRLREKISKVDLQLKKERALNRELKKQRSELKRAGRAQDLRKKELERMAKAATREIQNPVFIQAIPPALPLPETHPPAPSHTIAIPLIHTLENTNPDLDYSVSDIMREDTIDSITL